MATKYLDLLIAILFSSTCLLQDTSAAIKPEDASYTAESGKDFVISWQYDNEENTSQIFWTYKSSALPTANTIMSKIGTASAQVFNNFNVEHGGKGVIKLLSVTTNNTGIYFCQVSYALGSNLPSVTGTATLSVTGSTTLTTSASITSYTYISSISSTTILTTTKAPRTALIIGFAVGGSILLIVLVAVVVIIWLRKKRGLGNQYEPEDPALKFKTIKGTKADT